MDNFIIWSPGTRLDDIERQVILKAFGYYNKNKTATANALGIAIRTLDVKLEKYGADDAAVKAADEQRKANREFQLARARGIVPPTAAAPGRQGAEIREDSAEAQTRLLLQPDSSIPPQQPVPLPERSEVQEMLPPKVAASGSRGRR